VNIDEDARIVRAVGTRKPDTRRTSGAIPDNSDLEATGVQLSASGLTGGVEGNNFGTEKVVARCDIRDSERPFTTVIIKNLDSPVHWVVRNQSKLVDFEPRRRGCISGFRVAHRSHVDHDRTIVLPADSLASALPLTRLLVHLYGNLVAGLDRANLVAVLCGITS